MMYNYIDSIFARNQYIFENYGDEIRRKMNEFCNLALCDKKLMSHFIPENSEADIHIAFDEFIEDAFSGLLPDNMELYNVMDSPDIRASRTTDIFESLYKKAV